MALAMIKLLRMKVSARAKLSRIRMTSAMTMQMSMWLPWLPLSLLGPRFLIPVPDQWKLRIRMMLNDKMLVYKWQ